jgi:VIT1/CCC1 family predicted Fe2+/Mn2+ transporter
MSAADFSALARLRIAQRNEITEHQVYRRLARLERDPENRRTLERIAADELSHYQVFTEISGRKVRPDHVRVEFYVLVARLFGLTFGVKLMEKGEERAQGVYAGLEAIYPQLRLVREDEEKHEHALLGMLNDERLSYVGSVVLGLSDALVELTGVLAGLSFAFQNTRLIALSGLITGIAAALSMAASEYLSTRAEEGQNAGKSSLYTGIAYIVTVLLLVGPYLVLHSYLVCLALALIMAVLIILIFTFYLSIAKDLPFTSRFLEMAAISLGVAALSFGIGVLVKKLLGVDVGS